MKPKKEVGNPPVTPAWEKVIGLAGFFLICAGFVYLSWAAVTEKSGPPKMAFEVKEISDLGSVFLVKVKITNTGYESVTALQVEGRLDQKSGSPETNNVQVDYVPSQSSRNVGLFFDTDPKSGKLSFRALGYQEP